MIRKINFGTLSIWAIFMCMMLSAHDSSFPWVLVGFGVLGICTLVALLDKKDVLGHFYFFSPLLHLMYIIPVVLLLRLFISSEGTSIMVGALFLLGIECYQILKNGGIVDWKDTIADLVFGGIGLMIVGSLF